MYKYWPPSRLEHEQIQTAAETFDDFMDELDQLAEKQNNQELKDLLRKPRKLNDKPTTD